MGLVLWTPSSLGRAATWKLAQMPGLEWASEVRVRWRQPAQAAGEGVRAAEEGRGLPLYSGDFGCK